MQLQNYFHFGQNFRSVECYVREFSTVVSARVSFTIYIFVKVNSSKMKKTTKTIDRYNIDLVSFLNVLVLLLLIAILIIIFINQKKRKIAFYCIELWKKSEVGV